MTDVSIAAIDRLDLAFAPRAWPFADVRRGEIEAYFATLSRANPTLFNGNVLVMYEHELAGSVLRGRYLQTDYASFIAWRDWRSPDRSVHNCFALGALRGSDGAFLLGVMASHTSNPGRIYFPGGTPDPSDIVDGSVDLEHSVRRELHEETGLRAEQFAMAPGWTLVMDGPYFALIKLLQADSPAEVLRRRVLRNLADQQRPELADLHVVRSAVDLTSMVPRFAAGFLHHFWAREAASGAAERPASYRRVER